MKEKYAPIVEATGIFTLHDITTINHRPHPFMVGPRHIAHAADHHGGMLGEATLEVVPCAHRGCQTAYRDHTSDKVMALKLTADTTNTQANVALKQIVDQLDPIDAIDGFIFIKTEFDIKGE